MKKIIVELTLSMLWLAMTGCSMHEKTRNTAAEIHAQSQTARDVQITKQFENALPPINVNVSGTNNSVQVSPAPAKSTATMSERTTDATQSSDQSQETLKVSMPFGVKLILVAVGLAGILGVLWLVLHHSAAASAAYAAADGGMARLVSIVEDRLKHSTDPASQAQLATLQSAIEKERGKLAA